MNADVKQFYEYLNKTSNVEEHAEKAISCVYDLVKELKKNGNILSLDEAVIDARLSKKINKTISCKDVGIHDVKGLIVNNTKKTLFGSYKVDYKKISSAIEDQVIDWKKKELKLAKKTVADSGLSLPRYVENFAEEVKQYHDLYDEFLTKLQLSENFNDVIKLCDEMKKTLLLVQINNKIDDLESEINNLECRVNSLEDDINNLKNDY